MSLLREAKTGLSEWAASVAAFACGRAGQSSWQTNRSGVEVPNASGGLLRTT